MYAVLLKRILVLGFAAWSVSASAVLPIGADAPTFTTEAAMAGKATQFSLEKTLKKGPLVLYFFPKAFTQGCTIEAHLFAEASAQFQALGASVVGISNDDIETLKKFSSEACRDKFTVAADMGAQIMKKYDASMLLKPDMASRVSYVISPEGKIFYNYSSMSPDKHVENTMKAVERWRASQPK